MSGQHWRSPGAVSLTTHAAGQSLTGLQMHILVVACVVGMSGAAMLLT